MFLSAIHSSFLSAWDVDHDGIRRKLGESTILENTEHDLVFQIQIRHEHGTTLFGLNLMEEYKRSGPANKLLLHDNKAKEIREATQPVRKIP
jgi:hypothetical protein